MIKARVNAIRFDNEVLST